MSLIALTSLLKAPDHFLHNNPYSVILAKKDIIVEEISYDSTVSCKNRFLSLSPFGDSHVRLPDGFYLIDKGLGYSKQGVVTCVDKVGNATFVPYYLSLECIDSHFYDGLIVRVHNMYSITNLKDYSSESTLFFLGHEVAT